MNARYLDGYQADPRWQAAHADYLRESNDDETASQASVRRIAAIQAMARVELEYEAAS